MDRKYMKVLERCKAVKGTEAGSLFMELLEAKRDEYIEAVLSCDKDDVIEYRGLAQAIQFMLDDLQKEARK